MSGRLVWISDADRDKAARECTATSYGLNTLMHLFDSAPADPAEVIANALADHTFGQRSDAVLAALGVPSDQSGGTT